MSLKERWASWSKLGKKTLLNFDHVKNSPSDSKIVSAWKQMLKPHFYVDLYNEISEDHVTNGGAALAYYMLFAFFPGLIFVLSLLPYLPIHNLHETAMQLLRDALPDQVAISVEGIVAEVTMNRHSGLLSFGAVLTLWAASSGVAAVMDQLNITYDVKEARAWWKTRAIALALTVTFTFLIVTSFVLIVFGAEMQSYLETNLALGTVWMVSAQVFRWAVILFMMFLSFSLMFYFGPNVEQDFRFITPGSALGVLIFILATLGFRVYVEHFANYSASYGSLGAVIVLMLWLYISGLTILFGSEVNALAEHYSPRGKNKGEKREHEAAPRGMPKKLVTS